MKIDGAELLSNHGEELESIKHNGQKTSCVAARLRDSKTVELGLTIQVGLAFGEVCLLESGSLKEMPSGMRDY